MKVGLRLQQLDRMIIRHYAHIWDCCCDHGLLGMKLLQRGAADKIHFVDILQPLIAEVEAKLQRFFCDDADAVRWQVHCMDVAELSLADQQQRKLDASATSQPVTLQKDTQLVIIAGVGGDQLIEFVSAILANSSAPNIEFLLCPVHHNYKVRCALATLGLGLVDECLLQENGRFYEVIHVSKNAKLAISPVGCKMWDLTRADHRQYLNKTISHYQLKTKDPKKQVQQIISAYQSIEARLV